MKVKIPRHAVKAYLKRVGNRRPSEATENEFLITRFKILQAVHHPDEVHHGRKDMAQVHIKGDAGVVVGVQEEYEGPVYPYEESDTELFVPTVYPASTFVEETDEPRKQAEA
jgi:hypothetical protein